MSSRAACARAAAAAHAVAARARSSVPSRAGALTGAGSRAHRRVEGRGWREEVQEGASAAVAHAPPRTRANAPRGVHSALTPGGCPAAATLEQKKNKKAKDPNAPKRPQTAFFAFAAANRPKLLEANPELKGKVTQITTLLGERWRSLTDEEKKPFVKAAIQDKARYEKQMATYVKPQ